VKFWAQAWKAAHEKACAVGWLSSHRPKCLIPD
jgi:hypothetical protein